MTRNPLNFLIKIVLIAKENLRSETGYTQNTISNNSKKDLWQKFMDKF